MNTFQIVMLVMAVLVIGSGLFDFKALFEKFKNPIKDDVKKPVETKIIMNNVNPISTINYVPVKEGLKVSDLIIKWEELRAICVSNNLKASSSKLDDMFVTFLDLVKEEIKNDK